jgi:hypothetical protein
MYFSFLESVFPPTLFISLFLIDSLPMAAALAWWRACRAIQWDSIALAGWRSFGEWFGS